MGSYAEEDDLLPNSVLGKAHLLLAAFESGAHRLRLSELSRRSGVPKASAYRLAQELVQWGLLDRHGETYELGIRLFHLGQRVPASAVLRSVARPLMADLFTRTRIAVHLAVLDGTHVLFLEKIAGEANVLTHSYVGGRLPASCTATGRVLLSLAPDGPERVAALVRVGLPALTPRSVTDPEVLAQHLAAAVRQGYALEVEGVRAGYASLAVPVALGDGEYAALSVTAPVAQVSVDRCLTALQDTARSIERGVACRSGSTDTDSYGAVRPVRSVRSVRGRNATAVS
ncbi:IclR family transcriptional regulator [Streptomyces sp. TRM66268-LWL]|uniref:IclR family transcriptional regulator n=1 Tax=Streptomyces polyasparticus TaxID=2767826 RepID=A0ABR7SE21_9ACTN|nr:IclR family transcriptional regulator [Streptomyces polyasparticus]MBC9713222.1 IclR family transcriptional regulator [Streptomyces polyasparticus]